MTRFPVTLDQKYPCRGIDPNGGFVVYPDLLNEGDRVGSYYDDEGNAYGPMGVVRLVDGTLKVLLDEEVP